MKKGFLWKPDQIFSHGPHATPTPSLISTQRRFFSNERTARPVWSLGHQTANRASQNVSHSVLGLLGRGVLSPSPFRPLRDSDSCPRSTAASVRSQTSHNLLADVPRGRNRRQRGWCHLVVWQLRGKPSTLFTLPGRR